MKKVITVVLIQLFLTSFFLYSNTYSILSSGAAIGSKKTGKAISALLAKSDLPIKVCAWRPDGSVFLTSWENTLIIWDANSNKPVKVCSNINSPVVSLKFSKDGKYLVITTEDNSIILCYAQNFQEIARLKGEEGAEILAADFTNDNLNLIIPLDGTNIFSCFRLIMTKKFLSTQMSGHKKSIYSLDVNSKNNKLLSASNDGTVRLWSMEAYQCTEIFKAYTTTNIPAVFSPDGDSFIFADSYNSLVIKNLYGDTLLQIKDSDLPTTKVSFSPDGEAVAVALKNGTIRIYDSNTGAFIKNLECSTDEGEKIGQICDFCFSPDGNYIIGSSANGYFYRWTLGGKVYSQSKAEKNNIESEIQNIISEIEDTTEPEKIGEYYQIEQTAVSDSEISEITLEETMEIQSEKPVKQKRQKKNKKKAAESENNYQDTMEVSTFDKPKSIWNLGFSYSTLPADYYLGNVGMNLGFEKTFKRSPIFVGLDINLGAGIPSKVFPYDYYTDTGKQISSPWLYSLNPALTVGGELYSPKGSRIFFDVCGGPNIKILWDNQIYASVMSPHYYGYFGGVEAGIDLKFITFKFSLFYDANYGLQNGCSVNFSKRLYSGKRGKK